MTVLKLTVGPIPYFWSRDEVERFYGRLVHAPVDIVYLGETVCSRRRALAPEDWFAIGRTLIATGKRVVLSTLALIEAESELGVLARLCTNDEFPVEANDMAAVELLTREGRPFVGGPTLNVYNARTLGLLVGQGMYRWVPPPELSRFGLAAALTAWRAASPETALEVEVLAWGRLPLAHSARCFAARACGRRKDDCGFVCGQYPDGIPVATREGEPFLTFNGIQTQSAAPCNLIGELDDMQALGITHVRLSPQREGFWEALDLFARATAGEAVGPPSPDVPWCNGYWHGRAGRLQIVS